MYHFFQLTFWYFPVLFGLNLQNIMNREAFGRVWSLGHVRPKYAQGRAPTFQVFLGSIAFCAAAQNARRSPKVADKKPSVVVICGSPFFCSSSSLLDTEKLVLLYLTSACLLVITKSCWLYWSQMQQTSLDIATYNYKHTSFTTFRKSIICPPLENLPAKRSRYFQTQRNQFFRTWGDRNFLRVGGKRH